MILDASRPRRSRGSRRVEAAAHADEELPPRLIPSLRRFVATAVSIGRTRLALAGLELEEEIQRLIGATVMALGMLLLVNLALVVGTFAIVFAVAPEYRIATMITIALLYLLVAAGLGLRLRSIFTLRPPIFGATLAEIEKDSEILSRSAHKVSDALSGDRAGGAP